MSISALDDLECPPELWERLMKNRNRKYPTAEERRKGPKIERHWVHIKAVPEHVQDEDAKMALQYLLSKADKVEMMQFPKDQSQYRAYFDDGAYQGSYVFKWTENGLTPLKVYEQLKHTGWPGYSMDWMKDAAREVMVRELEKSA
jgi:hypothetical protein